MECIVVVVVVVAVVVVEDYFLVENFFVVEYYYFLDVNYFFVDQYFLDVEEECYLMIDLLRHFHHYCHLFEKSFFYFELFV